MEKSDFLEVTPTTEGRYRLLVDAITDYAIYMLDRDGNVSSWNSGAQRFKGYEAREIVGQHFSKFYTEEDRAVGLPARALRTAESEGKFENEGWRVRKDGTRFWAHVVIDPVRAPSGALIGYAKITRDLTERKKAEETLQRSEEQFRRLIQSVTDYAIYMLDVAGHVTSWNVGAQRIKGYRPDEIIGKHFSRFYTPQDRERGEPQRALETATREGRFEKEGERVRKDGSIFIAHVVIDPVRDESGELIGFAKVTRDVTQQKAAQRELERARETLFQSQKMDAVGQLTGGVAHDFNNLLMAVLGSLELAKKRLPDGDPQLARLIGNAVLGARRGAALTQRLLAFARRQAIEPQPTDLRVLVTNMVGLLERSVDPSVKIEIKFPPALGLVLADENQLELALLNLAVNARDAMAQGGTVTISAEERAIGAGHDLSAGAYVRLCVTDRGTGMDEETLARATEPFFTTKGVGKGTGLGLSMVHGMAEQIGGRLVLKSRKGEGTTAELWIPIARADMKAGSGTKDPLVGTQKARALRVLAVDDDPLVLFNTVSMLEDLGHTPFEANSGQEALAKLQAHAVDLIITDQAMPQMSGIHLIETARMLQPDLPAILATGYAEMPKGAGKGVLKLDKPFDEEGLASAIAKAFR